MDPDPAPDPGLVLLSLRSIMKIEGSGSISQRHGSADPDPHQIVTDPEHWFLVYLHDAPHVDVNAVAGVHLQTFALIWSSQSHFLTTLWSEKVF